MNKENIKWLAIQPLTGGMYLGAEEAIGHPAEAIISFNGLNDITYKDDKPNVVGNEHYLQTYLTKHNRMPPYYTFNHGMFDKDISTADNLDQKFEDIDLVVAVPVCSGLSMATSTANKETRDGRNCNMKYITHFVLTQIKPKIYVFENAPTFMGDQALGLRKHFENLAEKEGYSILYYKTDTQLHNNCQRRPRTFIIFMKGDHAPKYDFVNENVPIEEFFKNMEKSEFNNEPVSTSVHNYPLLDFIKGMHGKNWRNYVKGNLLEHLFENDKVDEFLEFAKDYDEYDKIKKYVEHVKYKKSIGKNYYCVDLALAKKSFAPVQFRSIPYMVHPFEDRTCSVREFIHLMGMPKDFEWYGEDVNLPKIGQNVPQKTAKFIVEQAIQCLDSNRETHDSRFYYQDNIKQKNYKIA